MAEDLSVHANTTRKKGKKGRKRRRMTMRKGKDKMRENGNSPSSVETMAEDLY
jgi:hypothetical protein